MLLPPGTPDLTVGDRAGPMLDTPCTGTAAGQRLSIETHEVDAYLMAIST
nr:hypothetical protein OG781_04040 [Streptomyces sp. NBC_00830]